MTEAGEEIAILAAILAPLWFAIIIAGLVFYVMWRNRRDD